MKIHRTKNAARNILVDGLMNAVNLLIPFFMRSITLHSLGVQYLGLNGLFRSLFSFLNLAELGVGSAIVFSMYRPIAEDNPETICALMRLYRRLYRLIGLVIAAAGLCFSPFLPVLIKGNVPTEINLHLLYFMHLGGTVLTYWLYPDRLGLLYAHQRTDVKSRAALAVHLAEYALKVAALVLFQNYYLYLAAQLLCQAGISLIAASSAKRMYPQYAPRGNLPKEKTRDIARRIRDLFAVKLSTAIFKSADTLVVSSFMGLTALAVYQNYDYVVVALCALLDVVVNACMAGVGNSLIVESAEKNYDDLRKFSLLSGWLLGVTAAMLLCLYQPFMALWMGQDHLLSVECMVCFVLSYYFLGLNRMIGLFKDAAGIWRRDRLRPLAAALANLALNLATVRWLGLYGVLLSSVIAYVLIAVPWLIRNLFREVFPRAHVWQYVREVCGLVLCALAGCAASWYICSRWTVAPFTALFAYGGISFAVSNGFFLLAYGRTPLFRACMAHMKRILRREKALPQ